MRSIPARRLRWRGNLYAAAGAAALVVSLASPAAANSGGEHAGRGPTTTPITHIVVVIGENHSFDNVFGTYQPRNGQHVLNLLSEGIVTASGAPGPNFDRAEQRTATDTTRYSATPRKTGAYGTLPRPNTTYIPSVCDGGQPANSPDARFPTNLPNGPYQITKYVPYAETFPASSGCGVGAYVGDPIHRFYQMNQQVDAGRNDLYVWTANTAGDDNGAVPPAPIYQGAVSMGYYNMAAGDAPYLASLARQYSMSDNYHQAVMGGTGANHIAIGTGDAAYYQGPNGVPERPPANQIENPNPKPGTNNNYTQDGYSGGSYSECADPSEPGVAAILRRLYSQPYRPFRGGDCAPEAYYLLNNYLPAYNGDGSLNTSSPFVVPPQAFPTIADSLSARGISWGYFGEGWNGGNYDPNVYCPICDPFQYASSVMTNPAKRSNLQDLSDFERRAADGTLPAVSFVKPSEPHDGHPAYSTLAEFEAFTKGVVTSVQANHELWEHTAIFVTMDETGGYYDSGYIQPIDFFGDGPRVPMIVVSPYTRAGMVDHTYTDHASILKFIEANWRLGPLSRRSLDNLPDPKRNWANPYVPGNRPAIGDLMTLFSFGRHHR